MFFLFYILLTFLDIDAVGRLSIELATLQVEDALFATLTLVTDYMDVFYACSLSIAYHTDAECSGGRCQWRVNVIEVRSEFPIGTQLSSS